MTEAGPLELLSGDEGENSDEGADIKLPGVVKGKLRGLKNNFMTPKLLCR